MARWTVCNKPGCPELTTTSHCAEHMPDAWAGSDRRARLPKNWPAIRARILKRDAGICHVCHKPGADAVDHLNPGDDHSDSNLAAIHNRPCHATKSGREGKAAQSRA